MVGESCSEPRPFRYPPPRARPENHRGECAASSTRRCIKCWPTKRSADIQRRYARDQSRPEISLQLGYTASGFAGESGNIDQNPFIADFTPVFTALGQLINIANTSLGPNNQIGALPGLTFTNPANTTGRFGKSFSSLFSNTYPTYTAQLNFSVPFRNDKGKGESGIADEQERQVHIQETAIVQHVIFDARNRDSTIRLPRVIAWSPRIMARVAADRVLLGEQRRFFRRTLDDIFGLAT